MNVQEGVLFRREDYAGFWRRLVIDVIDFSVVVVVCFLFATVLVLAFPPSKIIGYAIFLGWAVVWFSYFVLLKPTKISTLGYKISNVRIVGFNGERPSSYALILRLLFAGLGPLNMLLDLVWLSDDRHRQALRDNCAETYVIMENAKPVGRAKIMYRNYDILCWNLLFRELDSTVATMESRTVDAWPQGAGPSPEKQ